MDKLMRRLELVSWIMAAAACAVGIGWMWGWRENIPPQIPMFYSKPWGDEQLADPSWIWVPIGMATAAAIAGTFIKRGASKYPVLQMTVTAAMLISQIILITAVIRIIILVM